MKLLDAIRALREEGDLPSERADETRARIVATLQKGKRRRARVALLVLPIAAVLAAASASAAVRGRLPAVWQSITAIFRTGGDAAEKRLPAKAPPRESAPADETPTTPTGAQQVPEVPVASRAEPEPVRSAPAAPAHARARPALAAPPPASASPELREPPVAEAAQSPAPSAGPDSLALYRAAHRLHFAARDPAAALVAWDAYLGADPRGAFALEARYNRALCLVRLGRPAEARQALAPFAEGRFGGYRQSEARALLDTMDGASDAPP
jgi:hypothetical protein